mgnify:CR=1 FL=1
MLMLYLLLRLQIRIGLMTKDQYEKLAQRANEGENVWTEDEVSDCCGAEIIYQDICNDCKEHCGIQEEE